MIINDHVPFLLLFLKYCERRGSTRTRAKLDTGVFKEGLDSVLHFSSFKWGQLMAWVLGREAHKMKSIVYWLARIRGRIREGSNTSKNSSSKAFIEGNAI